MLMPPKQTAIIVSFTLMLSAQSVLFGQNSEYERRLAAMQQARGRGGEAMEDFNSGSSVRVAQNVPPSSSSRTNSGTSNRRSAPMSAPQAQARYSAPNQQQNYPTNRIAQQPRTASRSINPRVAQLNEGPIQSGGSPVIDSGIYENVIDEGEYYEEEGFDQCGDECGYFGCDHCSNRNVCPPGDCWLYGLGGVLTRGDYFFGAQGFQTAMYQVPGTENELNHDGNFGFYGGFNWGLPLCRLSCGLFSGQIGIRSVQSNFGGNEFTTENRDQFFLTTGLFRRVDYGIQGGVAVDVLWDNWFTNSQVAQMRSDIAYLWAGGTSFGFRYHTNLDNDITSGVIRGQTIDNIFTNTEDSYRFYARHEVCSGGFGEVFVGWTDSRQTIFGGEIDVPITQMLATQAGVTYYMDDTVPPTDSNRLGGYVNEAWNIYAGFSFRPCGHSYYRNYDRPFFNVADNGSMLLKRNQQ